MICVNPEKKSFFLVIGVDYGRFFGVVGCSTVRYCTCRAQAYL